MQSLKALEEHPDQDFYRFEDRDGILFIRYARAMKMAADCVECHNRPEFGFEGRWTVGEFRGARQVSMPVPDMTPIIDTATYLAVIVAIGASVLGTLVVVPTVTNLRKSLDQTQALATELDSKNEKLQGAMLARNRLFAGVSHDLRTPLNAVIGFSELLASKFNQGEASSNEQTYVTYIHESGLHLKSLVEEVLEVSSLEDGMWRPRDNAIDLGSLLDSLAPIMRRSLNAKNMALEISCWEGQPGLKADERALKRVLTNLVENAARYSGGTKAVIEARHDKSGTIELSVSDDGVGINEEQLQKLRQFRVRDTASDIGAEDGLGMGLWLIDTLMDAHAATVVYAKPAAGKGLRVSISFPADRVIL